MGGGSWTTLSYEKYTRKLGYEYDTLTKSRVNTRSAQDTFKARRLDKALNPYGVIRECVDSPEHPETVPVILALDVTGSMGHTAVETANKLNLVMTDLYSKIKDVEFMIMAIGDYAYDEAPLQVGQFESDIRIAEQLDKIWFEGGGGGNSYESYTAAWWFALNRCKLDCHKRGKKGIIITMGDENLNPMIPNEQNEMERSLKNVNEDVVETDTLYEQVLEKFDVYHLGIKDSRSFKYYEQSMKNTFGQKLHDHFIVTDIEHLHETIVHCILDSQGMIDKPVADTTKGMKKNDIKWVED